MFAQNKSFDSPVSGTIPERPSMEGSTSAMEVQSSQDISTFKDSSSAKPPPTAPKSPAANPSSNRNPTRPSSSVPKPTKRTTVEDLKKGLALLGLDVVGKKESLYKRLLKAFYRSEEPEAAERGSKPPEKEQVENYERWRDRAQSDWKSFLCFDVEATCRGGKEFDWPNEIIEFPVVLLRWIDETMSTTVRQDGDEAGVTGEEDKVAGRRRLVKIDTFHSYVRPTWQPTLSDFCISLTGITQETVDASPTFPEVLKKLEEWLDKHDLRDEDNRLKNAMWVTDGPWDLRDFIPKQLFITPVEPHPEYLFGQYLNIKQATQTVLSELCRQDKARQLSTPPPSSIDGPDGPERKSDSPSTKEIEEDQAEPRPPAVITTHKMMGRTLRDGTWKGPNFYLNIAGQVAALDLGEFEGRQHSGLDDATNIARILIALSEKERVVIEPNARSYGEKHRMKKWPWMGKDGKVHFEEWMSVGRDVTDRNTKSDTATNSALGGVLPGGQKNDRMRNIRTVKVQLSQANEMTQIAYASRLRRELESKQAAEQGQAAAGSGGQHDEEPIGQLADTLEEVIIYGENAEEGESNGDVVDTDKREIQDGLELSLAVA